MTQDLALGTVGIDLNLSPNDTNIANSVAIPSSNFQTTDGVSWNTTDQYHIYVRDPVVYGNLYNYYTATAGTGTTSIVNTTATGSICPKGWILPRNQSSTGYYLGTLLGLYNINTNGTLPIFPWSGQQTGAYNASSGASAISQPIAAQYWYANASTSDNAYFVGNSGITSESSLVYNHNSKRTHGFNIRCVAL